MNAHEISSFLVTKEEELIGILTTRDSIEIEESSKIYIQTNKDTKLLIIDTSCSFNQGNQFSLRFPKDS
jgi:hypothetical protein